MTTLIFHTPSKTCATRRFNGSPCTIIGTYPIRKKVKRCGGFVTAYLLRIDKPGVEFEDETFTGWAYPDEIHIEPEVT